MADDSIDLIPVRKSQAKHNRLLHPDLLDAPIRMLVEPYPTNGCVNGALANQTQQYFTC